MTDQDLLDKVASHLIAQGCRSEGGVVSSCPSGRTTICLYRGPGDLRCAVGCVIPDEDYRKDMEGKALIFEPIAECLSRHGLNSDLLTRLQRVHDNFEVEKWPTGIRYIATVFGLRVPACVALAENEIEDRPEGYAVLTRGPGEAGI